jgi:hypothetical protein
MDVEPFRNVVIFVAGLCIGWGCSLLHRWWNGRARK